MFFIGIFCLGFQQNYSNRQVAFQSKEIIVLGKKTKKESRRTDFSAVNYLGTFNDACQETVLEQIVSSM